MNATRPADAALLGVALALALAGPGCRYKSENQACLSSCQRDNDACLLGATTAPAVQACDERTTACVSSCR